MIDLARPPKRLVFTPLAAVVFLACQDAATAPPQEPLSAPLLAARGCAPGPPSEPGGGRPPDAGCRPVASVIVSPDAATVVIGALVQLEASLTDHKGRLITNRDTKWSSANETIATVDATGLVTGVGTGVVTITAESERHTGTAAITVISPPNFALDFSTDFVRVADADALDLTDTWSIEAWIKPRSPGAGAQHFISKWAGVQPWSYLVEIDPDRRFRVIVHDGSSGSALESVVQPVANVWQHVAVTFDHGTLRLYVGGTLDATLAGAVTPANSTRPLWFGCRPFDCAETFDGLLDEIRIWNVARTGAQIAAAMSQRLQGSEAGLVGYWRFDEGSGDIAFDATSNGHDGQLGNAVGPDANDPQWTADAAPIT